MHIYEGVLSAAPYGREILAAGWGATAVGTAIGLRRIDIEQIPRVAVLSAAFFVVSSIHIPLGVTAEHLTLTALMGVILGWAAFPAVLAGLLLQAAIFGLGGPIVLGVNTLIMAGPAVVCGILFRGPLGAAPRTAVAFWGFAAGAAAVALAGLGNGLCLFLAGKQFELFGAIMAALHLPLAVAEGLATASVMVLVRQVRPDLLGALGPAGRVELSDG